MKLLLFLGNLLAKRLSSYGILRSNSMLVKLARIISSKLSSMHTEREGCIKCITPRIHGGKDGLVCKACRLSKDLDRICNYYGKQDK